MFSERKYNRFNFYSNHRYYHVVPILIMINVLVFLLQNISMNNYGTFSFSPVTAFLALSPAAITTHFQIWRIVTYMFVHGGFFHILLNMWGLYLFGSMLEQRIGSTRFLFLYFVSGIVGALLWIIFNWGSYIPCIGASGALFGVMVAAAMMFPNVMIMLLIPPIPLKLKTFVIVYAIIESLASVGGIQGGVAHLVHLGGLIGGYFYMCYAFPRDTYDVIKFIREKMFSKNHHSAKRTSASAAKNWKFTNNSSSRLDAILDKISKTGINSLSEEEMSFLKKARDNMRGK